MVVVKLLAVLALVLTWVRFQILPKFFFTKTCKSNFFFASETKWRITIEKNNLCSAAYGYNRLK